MATFLDFSLLSGAKAIFAFLLIFAMIYGLLSFTKLFGLTDALAAIVALSIAMLAILSPSVVAVIEVITPWYVLMILVIIFILLTTMIFGSLGSNVGEISKNMGGKYKTVMVWIVVISIIIFVAGLGKVFLSGSESQYSLNTGGTGTVVVQANQTYVIQNGSTVVYTNTATNTATGGKGVVTFIDTLFHPKVIGMILFLVLASMVVLLLGYGSK